VAAARAIYRSFTAREIERLADRFQLGVASSKGEFEQPAEARQREGGRDRE
jgi:hypothetical protein